MTKFQFDLSSFPLRESPSHKAEMVSEILYGEAFIIRESKGNWHLIELEHDGYKGWLEREDDFEELEENRSWICPNEFTLTRINGSIQIPVGAKLINSEKTESVIAQSLNHVLNSFINTPYYWGGRTKKGIDCSGFVQVAFSTQNISLPRDAYQQAEIGSKIEFGKHKTGDLAFFENDKRKITHVGVLLEENRIIHASEKVRIDTLTDAGIYRSSLKKLTHRLASIKRVV